MAILFEKRFEELLMQEVESKVEITLSAIVQTKVDRALLLRSWDPTKAFDLCTAFPSSDFDKHNLLGNKLHHLCSLPIAFMCSVEPTHASFDYFDRQH